jgi:hypothetical protein
MQRAKRVMPWVVGGWRHAVRGSLPGFQMPTYRFGLIVAGQGDTGIAGADRLRQGRAV